MIPYDMGAVEKRVLIRFFKAIGNDVLVVDWSGRVSDVSSDEAEKMAGRNVKKARKKSQ